VVRGEARRAWREPDAGRCVGLHVLRHPDGTATVVHGGKTITTLGPGDFFGEGALVGTTGRRNASVIAESPMRVGAMFGTEFRLLERDLPEVGAQIRETLAVRQAELAG